MKKILYVLIGFIFGLSFAVSAIYVFDAKEIEFHSNDSNWNVENVEDALKDLKSNYVPKIDYINKVYIFSYKGYTETFIPEYTGTYKIELWGASGGNASGVYGGKGAYTSGIITLTKDEELYINVGGVGLNGVVNNISYLNGGYNGGGLGYISRNNCSQNNASGGGATDVRISNGELTSATSLRSRIMVAAGGGGAFSEYCAASDNASVHGGAAGSLVGGNPSYVSYSGFSGYNPTGATQTNGGRGLATWTSTSYTSSYVGTFGIGGNGNGSGCSYSGGGGGYYGGASGGWQPGAGGSSFISGYTGCNAVNESGVHTGQPNHYSGLVFSNSIMLDGNSSMPTHDGKSTMVGNSGNGYAKITLISLD